MNKEQAAKEFSEHPYRSQYKDSLLVDAVENAFTAGATWQEQHTHPHSTYMEFAEWCGMNARKYHTGSDQWLYSDRVYTTPDLFQYWINNVKNKG